MENRLMQSRFIDLVTAPPDNPSFPEELKRAYKEFNTLVCLTTFAEEDFPSRYTILSESSVQLGAYKGRITLLGSRFEEYITYYVEVAHAFIESQLNLLKLSLRYPDNLSKKTISGCVSPIYLSPKCSKTKITELICSLDAYEAFVDTNGSKISFRDLVTGFELFFNIKISKPYNKREEILNRKKEVAIFLNELIESLREKSQK